MSISLWICPLQLQARVLDLNFESFASYLKAHYLPALPGTDPFADSSGSGVSWNGRHSHLMGYEFGFLWNGSRLNWKLGVEILQAPEQKGIQGLSSSGVPLFTMNSAVSGLILKTGFEGHLHRSKQSRVSIIAEGGSAQINLQNTYFFSSAGASLFSLSDFREEIAGTSIFLAGGLLYETHLNDTTTVFVETAYRSLKFLSFLHRAAITGFQGSVAKGDVALTNSGITRFLDLSSVGYSVGLRFYL
ncbi:MAG: hypothetical protein WCH11_01835 [Bdellovibrio sp.]